MTDRDDRHWLSPEELLRRIEWEALAAPGSTAPGTIFNTDRLPVARLRDAVCDVVPGEYVGRKA